MSQLRIRFVAVIVACLFLALGVVAGGNGKQHDQDKEHDHGHGHPHGYASPHMPEHP